MLISRALMLQRLAGAVLRPRSSQPLQAQSKRMMSGHQWFYREGNINHPKWVTIGSNAIGAFMWWWILWHCYHEYGHIIGEFEYPDPSVWTNKELGIPEDLEE